MGHEMLIRGFGSLPSVATTMVHDLLQSIYVARWQEDVD